MTIQQDHQITTSLASGLEQMQRSATGRSPKPQAVGLQAALRRSAGRGFGRDPQADAALLGMLKFKPTETGELPPLTPWLLRVIDDASTVASLVALTKVRVHQPTENEPRTWAARSLGRDLRAVHARRPSGIYDSQLRALLRADRHQLGRGLRRTLTLMAADGATLDVAALHRDLGQWNNDASSVQKRWAYHFWSSPQDQPTTVAQADEDNK